MSTPDRIQEILGADGLLARSLSNFEPRESQNKMARIIAEAIGREMPALVEAGTGTGKTLGYLVPLWLSDKKSVISTRTKTLQEQIFFKDIPLLAHATGHRLSAMLMKGRKNYLCLRRYHQYFTQASILPTEAGSYHKRLQKWLQHTRLADRAELAWLRDDDPLWDAISSTADQCHGSRCLHGEDCFLNALRREAARSRIIIANHHLLFADLMVKEGGFGEVLPRFEVLVCDEAQGIEEIATQYLGNRLSDHQLILFIDDLEEALKDAALEDDQDLKGHLASVRAGAIRLRDLFATSGPKGRLTEASIKMINEGPAAGIRRGLDYIQKEWKEALSEYPLTYQFYDDWFDSMYEKEERFGRIISFFAILAISISCIGILGLAIFTAEKRTKEIGIRKVNGATAGNILMLLTREFTLLVLIAFVIASPVAFLAVRKWLQDFAYQTDISWWVFVVSGLSALFIAWSTVGWNSFRAAKRNPVEALRAE